MMDYIKLYETEIFPDEGPSFKAVTIPTHSLADISAEEIISSLDLKSIDSVESGRYIRAVVTALAAENESDIRNWRSFQESALNEKIQRNQYLYELAEYVTMSRILAFGNSPLTGESIGNLLTSASGPVVGAHIGFVLAGSTPLLFIAVPAGMIFCGDAAGVVKAFEEGLKTKIIALLRQKKKT
jgi:hypothetical protein